MRAFIFVAVLFFFAFSAEAQQPDTYYILVPLDSINQSIISQLKAFNSNAPEGRFMQDDTSSFRKIIFQQDTAKVYVILSWEGIQSPTSVPDSYSSDSIGMKHRIFTTNEIKSYINQNEYIDGL